MDFLYSLCSSSKGNCTYIGSKKQGIVVDTGITCKGFFDKLKSHDIEDDAVKAIFITHEHTDHISGLFRILKRINVPVYASEKTLEAIKNKQTLPENAKLIDVRQLSCDVNGIHTEYFSTPHDCVDSLGYSFTLENGKRISICTDLGKMQENIYNDIKKSDFILLESNYDEAMLYNGHYPYMLKQRIASDVGHLSNKNCSDTLINLLNDGVTDFMLGHLSQNNNRPDIAYMNAITNLKKAGAEVMCDYNLVVAKCSGTDNLIEF